MRPFSLEDDSFLGIPIKRVHYEFECEKINERETYNEVIVHHLGNKQTLSSILDSHVNKEKFTPIGYHFLIDKEGVLFYTRPIENVGGHTFGYNRTSIGIALFGNFNKDIPTQEQIETLNSLVNTLKDEYLVKKIVGHNQAVYNLLVKEYSFLTLEKKDFSSFMNYFDYEQAIADVRDKILESTVSDDVKKLAEKVTLCPGFFIQDDIKKINKLVFENN